MQRIIQVSIDFDEEGIRKSIEKNAEKQVIETVTQETRDWLKTRFNRFGKEEELYKELVENKINEIIEERKDDIVKEAITLLADKMYRSKKVREAMNELIDDFKE